MKIKIKYLLGLLVVGVGLLFGSQSFAFCSAQNRVTPIYTFDLITVPFSDSTSYQYHSNKRFQGYLMSSNSSYFLNSSFYQDLVSVGITSGAQSIFNKSYLGYSEQTGYRGISVACYETNVADNQGKLAFYYGLGSDFGQLAFGKYYQDRTDLTKYGPTFFFGNEYFGLTSNYRGFNGSNIPSTYYRLFYNQPVNLSDPVSNINLFEIENNPRFFARQYFTDYGFSYMYSGSVSANSNSKTFRDLGTDYNKSFNIGGYGMGYSYVLNTLGENFVGWNDFSFVSVGSRCLQNLMYLGMSDPNSGTSSGCQQVGLLVLKGDSYVSKNNNASAIILSKDPNNRSRILYQQFDCAEDSIDRLFDTDYCQTLSHGYITIDGTGNVLPFGSFDYYYIGSGNKFLDVLFAGDPEYGYIGIENGKYCLHSIDKTACFSLTQTPSDVSLQELYLNGSISGIPAITNVSDITEQMILNCKGPYYNTPDGLPPAYCNFVGTNFTGSFYQDIGVDSSGNIVISIIQQDPNSTINLSSTSFILDGSGNYTAICTGDCYGEYIYYGTLDSSFTTTGYFDNFFLSTGNFFKCPYPYTQKLVIGKKLINSIGRDPFVPINCFIASYLAGKNNILFNSGLQLVQGGPLINSTSDMAKLLYHFFDFLICVGLILFGSVLGRFFNR